VFCISPSGFWWQDEGISSLNSWGHVIITHSIGYVENEARNDKIFVLTIRVERRVHSWIGILRRSLRRPLRREFPCGRSATPPSRYSSIWYTYLLRCNNIWHKIYLYRDRFRDKTIYDQFWVASITVNPPSTRLAQYGAYNYPWFTHARKPSYK